MWEHGFVLPEVSFLLKTTALDIRRGSSLSMSYKQALMLTLSIHPARRR